MAIAAMIRMIAITMSSSIKLNPRESLPRSFPVCLPAELCFPSTRINFSRTPQLLERGAGDCWCAAVRGVTDHAALVAEEPALAALSHRCRLAHNRVGLETSASADCRGCRGSHIGEEITALRGGCCCCRGQDRVNQNRRAANCNAARCASHSCQRPWELHAPARRIGNRRSVDGTNRTDRRRLIGRHAGAQQVRNCDGRDNQNDRDDDQQFDQRESLLIPFHVLSLLTRCEHKGFSWIRSL